MSLISALVAPLSISNAIKKASQATGTDFSYLLKTAARESSFKQGAKAKTSSAAGLFQFIESTWLKTVKEVGDKFGLDKYTPHIFTTRSGRHYVPNDKLRKEILQLRHNPEVSAMMAGAFTQQNSEFIASKIGRTPSPGELYIAHFLGPNGASELISLVDSKPNARANRYFRKAARANRPIFYSRGRPRTVKQVYNELVKDHAKQQAIAATRTTPATKASPLKVASAPVNSTPAIAKPVVEPIKSVVPAPGHSPALLHKVSVTQKPASADAGDALKEPGVEAKVIEAATPAPAIGLLGQKGSPMVNTTKIASLTHNNLNIPLETMNDAASGSIGSWITLIEPPAAEKSAKDGSSQNAKKHDDVSAQVKRRAARRKTGSRAPRLLEQSASRNANKPHIRMAVRARGFEQDFWKQVSLSGN
ncbi:MAG: transglycosylase SLT domain-containing protein [Gammaproteobacteria bacterium]